MTHAKNDSMPIAFITGLFIGGMLTALLTPKRRSELRRSISSRAESMRDSMTDKAEEITDTASENIDKVKSKLESVSSKASNKIEDTLDSK